MGIVYPTGHFKAIPIVPMNDTVENNSAIFGFQSFSVPMVPIKGCERCKGFARIIIEKFNEKIFILYSTNVRDVITFDLKTQKKHTIPNSGMFEHRVGNVDSVRIGHMAWVRINVLESIR